MYVLCFFGSPLNMDNKCTHLSQYSSNLHSNVYCSPINLYMCVLGRPRFTGITWATSTIMALSGCGYSVEQMYLQLSFSTLFMHVHCTGGLLVNHNL